MYFGAEAADQSGELHVVIGAFARFAGDDQRGARFVDEDVVHLIDDGVVQPALAQLRRALHHVVAQVVETELVVGAIGDVGGIGLLPRDRTLRLEPVIRRREFGVKEKTA